MNKEKRKAIEEEKELFYKEVDSSLQGGDYYKLQVDGLIGLVSLDNGDIVIRLNSSSFKEVAEVLKI